MFNFKKIKETYAYNDISLVPAYSDLKSRSDANPKMHDYKLPIMASCMNTLGKKLMEEIITNNIPFIAHRAFSSAEEQFKTFTGKQEYDEYSGQQISKCVWFAVGSVQKYKDWIDYLYDRGVRRFCVDMAHGDSKACIDTIKYIKDMDKFKKGLAKQRNEYVVTLGGKQDFPVHVIAGNVATLEGFKRLQKAGADGIRVGIASGSICSTALETGMGVPILSNIMEIAPHKKNTWLIADGGAHHCGDIAKAIYFGADFVMLGKMLAATDLAEGKCYNKFLKEIKDEVIYPETMEQAFLDEIQTLIDNKEIDIKAEEIIEITDIMHDPKFEKIYNNILNRVIKYKGYNGMASRGARKGLLNYASVEGRSGLIEYEGSTKQFIHDTYLRLQASLSYGGARDWNEFRKNVKAVKRSQAAISAGKTHLDILFDK